jgi:bisphosphoglycerate-independent phosphoglycerate mutase (AlkP superfamily)
MTKAYLDLTKKALAKDLTISVFDGEEWQVKRATAYKAIKEAIESVDECQLRLRNKAGEVVGWALIVHDLDQSETVADHTYNALMCELCGTTFD